MKKHCFHGSVFALLALRLLGIAIGANAASAAELAQGADVGWLSQMEAAGVKFSDRDGV